MTPRSRRDHIEIVLRIRLSQAVDGFVTDDDHQRRVEYRYVEGNLTAVMDEV